MHSRSRRYHERESDPSFMKGGVGTGPISEPRVTGIVAMTSPENPKTLAELCEWLEANRNRVHEAINQVSIDRRKSARVQWSELLHTLEADGDAKVFQAFQSFLSTLLGLPDVESILPSGFSDYLLLLGRQPTLTAAQGVRQQFEKVVKVLNEFIMADDENPKPAGSSKATPPAAAPNPGECS